MSNYIKELIKDYKTLSHKSFLAKHGPTVVKLAKKMSERQDHEKRIDSQVRYN